MDILISVTTLGNGANAVIRTITAVSFDIESNDVFDEFQRTIDIDSCLESGLTVDGRSLLQWKDSTNEEPVSVHLNDALFDLRDAFAWEDARVWVNITQHSAAVLDTAYRQSALAVPWRVWNLRDVVTLTGEIEQGTRLLDTVATLQAIHCQANQVVRHVNQA